MEKTGTYIVVCGNPVDGLAFYGPFKTYDDALAYGENIDETEWWIANLAPPSDQA